FNAGNEPIIPGSASKNSKKMRKTLFPEHTAFQIESFDTNPSLVLIEARNKVNYGTRSIELRFIIVSQWKAAGVSFSENCVFVDKVGFNEELCSVKKG
ncbi:hypothetical protein INT47_011740, partial [Mucor saturninus]